MTTSEENKLRNHISYLRGKVLDLHERCSGRSTRLIDKYVQEIYSNKGKWVEITDHYPSPQAAFLLFDHIMRRITIEHEADVLKVDKSKRYPMIMLVKCRHDYLHDEIDKLNADIDELKAKLPKED